MKRLHITAEGQTEEYFVKNTLTYYLGDYNISTDVRCVLTSKDIIQCLVSQEKFNYLCCSICISISIK